MHLPFTHKNSPFLSPRHVAEFLAVFGLATAVALASGSQIKEITPLIAALTLCVFVYTVGPVSGAHVNPAITVGLASVGKISWREAGWYVLWQLLGGLAAMLAIHGMATAGWIASPAAATIAGDTKAAIGEVAGAFILAFGVSSVAWGKVHAGASGMVVALSLLLGIAFTALSGLSLGVLNPAVAIGVLQPFSEMGPRLVYIALFYMAAPVVGAILAAQLYRWMGK